MVRAMAGPTTTMLTSRNARKDRSTSGPAPDCRKRNHDKRHEYMHQTPISDSADESMVDQYRQPAAGRVVDRRGPQRDDEMQENTQQRRACAALECATSKQSAGDTLKQS